MQHAFLNDLLAKVLCLATFSGEATLQHLRLRYQENLKARQLKALKQ
jgi:hypothetical protein